jgi:hypothetical protein
MIYLSVFGILAFVFALVAYVQVAQLRHEVANLTDKLQEGKQSR